MNIYENAKEQFANIGVDTENALALLDKIPISLQCWQGDDVSGFENLGQTLSGGIQSTGDFPGRARNASELRAHIDSAFSLIPGKKKLNLHAIYGDVASVSRADITPARFAGWAAWAKARQIGLDFNPTLFSHEKAAQGLTLSHPDKSIRDFWIAHCKACRKIAAFFGRELGLVCVLNVWAPDGFKDIPADTLTPRIRLTEALDEIFSEKADESLSVDAVESKLFGIGLESYTVGSHEFYLGYAATRGVALCLDAGHFHPTEVVSAKISAASLFIKRLLLHVSRPVRWDSDHVVILDDELISIAREVIRHKLTERVFFGLDYFDGSIDRIKAWAIGARNLRKALLIALLEPYERLREREYAFDFTARILMLEEFKTLPWQAVWNEYCKRADVPANLAF